MINVQQLLAAITAVAATTARVTRLHDKKYIGI